ncbi:hypothetical protein A9P93_27155 [Klebsiella pneumoniae]|nr:hypothetical protein A9P93_27155 [Klebsiella pneumoniae]
MHYVTTVYFAAFLAILFVTLIGYIFARNINVSEYFRCTFVVILIQSIFIGYVAKQGVAWDVVSFMAASIQCCTPLQTMFIHRAIYTQQACKVIFRVCIMAGMPLIAWLSIALRFQ